MRNIQQLILSLFEVVVIQCHSWYYNPCVIDTVCIDIKLLPQSSAGETCADPVPVLARSNTIDSNTRFVNTSSLCTLEPVPTFYYSVVGTGFNMTASSCGNYDTVLGLYDVGCGTCIQFSNIG